MKIDFLDKARSNPVSFLVRECYNHQKVKDFFKNQAFPPKMSDRVCGQVKKNFLYVCVCVCGKKKLYDWKSAYLSSEFVWVNRKKCEYIPFYCPSSIHV